MALSFSILTKYLGAILSLDQSLSYETMVNSVIKKASARLKFLYR